MGYLYDQMAISVSVRAASLLTKCEGKENRVDDNTLVTLHDASEVLVPFISSPTPGTENDDARQENVRN